MKVVQLILAAVISITLSGCELWFAYGVMAGQDSSYYSGVNHEEKEDEVVQFNHR